MKTFQEFMQESSLSRIKSKSDKGGMAILSGSRGDKSKKENKARAKQLDKDIRGKGLPGATKVTGSYMEKDKSGKEKMRYYKKNKSVAIENVGYKVYFGMSSKTLSSSSDFEVEDDATKAQIKKAFTKSLTAKKMNKQILSRFVELIA